SISYEYDPSDALKARELYLTEINGSYQKDPSEDVISIRTGIMGNKGRIHINVGAPLKKAMDEHFESMDSGSHAPLNKREQVTLVANILDQQIRKNFKNWPTNYIAFDLLAGNDSMKENYSSEEKSKFLNRMETQLNSTEIGQEARPRLRQIFLESYANSVRHAAPISE
ncbi:MAG: acyltransferase, partial [Bdellovibrionia bacterium]